MIDRRGFVQQAIGLLLGTALAGPAKDEFLLQCGCLWCGGRRQGRCWAVAITVYVERARHDGATMIRRMVPTALLRDSLRKNAVLVEFDGDSLYPALVGTSAHGPTCLHQRLGKVLARRHLTDLYSDPAPWEWEDFVGT